jgi:hypothetical protein
LIRYFQRNILSRKFPVHEASTDGKLFSAPPDVFPDLESLWGTDCTDREKAQIVVALLQIGLRPDADL